MGRSAQLGGSEDPSLFGGQSSIGDRKPTAEELAAGARERGVEVHLLQKGEDPGEAARSSSAGILGMGRR
jgi:hypothetical protein